MAAFLTAVGAPDCSSIVPPRGTGSRQEGRELLYRWCVGTARSASGVFTSVLADFLCSCCDLRILDLFNAIEMFSSWPLNHCSVSAKMR